MLADRRLSIPRHHPKDNARKVMILETADGKALLGYAGLGRTAGGTEPSDWISAVLRTRNVPLVKCLDILAKAFQQEFPKQMAKMPGPDRAHVILVSAFIAGEPRLYSISLELAPDGKTSQFKYVHHVNSAPRAPRPPRLAIAGSGKRFLVKEKRWMRDLLRIVRANDRGLVSHHTVADQLAALNSKVHRGTADKSVGPRCIVAWQGKNSGGGHRFYTDAKPDDDTPALPTIALGMDIEAIAGMMMRRIKENMASGRPMLDMNVDELNNEAARLPTGPDEKLS